MRLIQIPFSHNCIKVRRALELKGLEFETRDIHPLKRDAVIEASGQPLVPVLIDDGRVVFESTAILHHLEEAHPGVSLLPADPADHADCWLIEDWADAVFARLTQRIAYWQVLATPGRLERAFFPEAAGIKRALMTRRARKLLTRRFKLSETGNARDEVEAARLAAIAVNRLGGRSYLFGKKPTVADVALAAMAGPLMMGAEPLRNDPAVRTLTEWCAPILGESVVRRYQAGPAV